MPLQIFPLFETSLNGELPPARRCMRRSWKSLATGTPASLCLKLFGSDGVERSERFETCLDSSGEASQDTFSKETQTGCSHSNPSGGVNVDPASHFVCSGRVKVGLLSRLRRFHRGKKRNASLGRRILHYTLQLNTTSKSPLINRAFTPLFVL